VTILNIYDCFTFFNELDLLEIRLNELDSLVDYFIIVEADKTHTGIQKKYIFEENKQRFKKFFKKIIYIKIKLPLNKNSWILEKFQRMQINSGLTNCNLNDIIMISDIDEIPNKQEIKNIIKKPFRKNTFIQKLTTPIYKNYSIYKRNIFFRKIGSRFKQNVFVCKQKLYYYYLNGLLSDNWKGTVITNYDTYKHIFNSNPQILREIRDKQQTINDGGWHFSYLGGYNKIIKKLSSFAHTEYNTSKYKNKKFILNKIETGKNLFNDKKINYITIDSTYPNWILKNTKKYKKLIKT